MPVFHDSLTQGSAEWLAFRKDHISATDLAIIMGIHKEKSPYMLWQEKLGLKEFEFSSYVKDKILQPGHEKEPIALAAYCEVLGREMRPAVVTLSSSSWAMASLDAIDLYGRHIGEIKCMGKKNHEEAMNGIVNPLYMYQMQWQMFVTELHQCDYFVYSEESNHIITIKRDQDLINKMIIAAEEFLEMKRTITPPPFTDLDYEDKTDDAHWDSLMASYALYDGLEKDGKIGKEHIKQLLVEHANGRNVRGSNSKFTKVTTKGRIQYDKIEILKEIDLEQYRSEPIESYRVTFTKE